MSSENRTKNSTIDSAGDFNRGIFCNKKRSILDNQQRKKPIGYISAFDALQEGSFATLEEIGAEHTITVLRSRRHGHGEVYL